MKRLSQTLKSIGLGLTTLTLSLLAFGALAPAVYADTTYTTTTTVTLSSGTDPANYGDSLTFSATVRASNNDQISDSSVSFTANGSPLAGCTDVASVEVWVNSALIAEYQCTTSALTGGVNDIVATYNGAIITYPSSVTFEPSSGSVDETIDVPTDVTSDMITSSGSPSNYGSDVLFHSSIQDTTYPLTTVNDGTVSYTVNGSPIAGCTSLPVLSSDCSTTTLPSGNDTIESLYSGTTDGATFNFAASNDSLVQVVNPEVITTPPITAPTCTESYYTVVSGDNLYDIGLATDVNWHQLVNLNNIPGPNYIIYPGEKITLPCGVSGSVKVNNPTGGTKGTKYVVKPGDNLYDIGLSYGVNWPIIASANGIVSPYLIFPREPLIIP